MPHRPQLLAAWMLGLLLVGQMASGQAAAPAASALSQALLQRYLSNEQLAAWADEYAHRCSRVARKLSIGRSVRGVELWALEISDAPGVDEAEPAFRFIANMHGDEPSGRMLLPQLAEWLCANADVDARAGRLVKHVHLYLLPSMNPDGFAIHRRNNAAGVDLNRNFPDPMERGSERSVLLAPLPNAQPETRAIMDWTLATPFVAGANLHEGAVCANYPFDGFSDHSQAINGSRHPAPDDAAFVHLAKVYARAHATMARSKEFEDGITNGAQWYPVYGGMQDWSYLAGGMLEITLELSDTKWRPEADLGRLWEENRDALLALPLAAALGGVRGRVLSAGAGGAPLPGAVLMVVGVARNSSARGRHAFFARPLPPGSYSLTAVADGHAPLTQQVAVPADGSGATLDFRLTPLGDQAALAPASGQQQQQQVPLPPPPAAAIAAAGPAPAGGALEQQLSVSTLAVRFARLDGRLLLPSRSALALVGLAALGVVAAGAFVVCQGPRHAGAVLRSMV